MTAGPVLYSLRSLKRRFRRNLLTVLALAGGTAAVVSMLGISQAAADRIVDRLEAYEATSLTVTLPGSTWDTPEEDLISEAAALPGVESVGTIVVPNGDEASVVLQGVLGGSEMEVGLAVGTEQGMMARGASLIAGAFPAQAVLERDPAVVMLGVAVARDLNVSTLPGENRLLVDGRTATVVGIIEDGGQNSALAASVLVPPQTAAFFGETPITRRLEVNATADATGAVAQVIAAAILPSNPEDASVVVPPSPRQLRQQLTADTNGLVVTLTVVTLVATSFGIITTMQISVWERRSEIGLTRALGMSKGDVARVFLVECIALAVVGSTAGWLTGVLINSSVLFINGWDMVLPLEVLALPPLGVIVGAISGLVPARNAARVNPAELLRG